MSSRTMNSSMLQFGGVVQDLLRTHQGDDKSLSSEAKMAALQDDLKVAAEIGQMLLEKNMQLEESLSQAEARVTNAEIEAATYQAELETLRERQWKITAMNMEAQKAAEQQRQQEQLIAVASEKLEASAGDENSAIIAVKTFLQRELSASKAWTGNVEVDMTVFRKRLKLERRNAKLRIGVLDETLESLKESQGKLEETVQRQREKLSELADLEHENQMLRRQVEEVNESFRQRNVELMAECNQRVHEADARTDAMRESLTADIRELSAELARLREQAKGAGDHAAEPVAQQEDVKAVEQKADSVPADSHSIEYEYVGADASTASVQHETVEPQAGATASAGQAPQTVKAQRAVKSPSDKKPTGRSQRQRKQASSSKEERERHGAGSRSGVRTGIASKARAHTSRVEQTWDQKAMASAQGVEVVRDRVTVRRTESSKVKREDPTDSRAKRRAKSKGKPSQRGSSGSGRSRRKPASHAASRGSKKQPSDSSDDEDEPPRRLERAMSLKDELMAAGSSSEEDDTSDNDDSQAKDSAAAVADVEDKEFQELARDVQISRGGRVRRKSKPSRALAARATKEHSARSGKADSGKSSAVSKANVKSTRSRSRGKARGAGSSAHTPASSASAGKTSSGKAQTARTGASGADTGSSSKGSRQRGTKVAPLKRSASTVKMEKETDDINNQLQQHAKSKVEATREMQDALSKLRLAQRRTAERDHLIAMLKKRQKEVEQKAEDWESRLKRLKSDMASSGLDRDFYLAHMLETHDKEVDKMKEDFELQLSEKEARRVETEQQMEKLQVELKQARSSDGSEHASRLLMEVDRLNTEIIKRDRQMAVLHQELVTAKDQIRDYEDVLASDDMPKKSPRGMVSAVNQQELRELRFTIHKLETELMHVRRRSKAYKTKLKQFGVPAEVLKQLSKGKMT